MSTKTILSVFIAFTIGYATSPSYGNDIISCDSFESCPTLPTDEIQALEARIEALEALLAGVSRGIDHSTSQDTLRFTNMNVQIVNGNGMTGGDPDGRGNLIIGRNESRGSSECPDGPNCDRRSGSHMLVIGTQNNYTSYGGMVVGHYNETSSKGAVVSGGQNNSASGFYASVSGGDSKTAATAVCIVGDSGVDC